MSHREYITYFINATSKSSSSVDVACKELENVTVSVYANDTICVMGRLNDHDKKVLDKHFHICDNIFDADELTLLEE